MKGGCSESKKTRCGGDGEACRDCRHLGSFGERIGFGGNPVSVAPEREREWMCLERRREDEAGVLTHLASHTHSHSMWILLI